MLPNVFGLYNSADYINANDTVLHIGYSVSANPDSISHNQYSLIRDGYAEDFLNGVPGSGAATQQWEYQNLLGYTIECLIACVV